MEIRKMTISDIDDVVRIHKKALPTTTARLGLLPFFYQTIINDINLHIALVATEHNRIVGAITATHDAHKTQHALFKPWMILRAIITSHVPISELINRTLTERSIMTIAHPYQTILTIVVDTKHQRKGIGKKLITSLKLNGDVYVDTEHALGFYTRCGFRFFKTIKNSVIAVKTLTPAPKKKILG